MDLEVIRRILVEAKTTGVEQTTSQLKGLSAGYEGVTVASQKTETATESVARKFAQLESRLDPASRAARNLAKDIATLDAQLAQTGNIERHGQLLDIATQNAIKLSGGAKAATGVMEGFKQTLSGVSGQLVGMAAGMGPVGIFLSALGPWGIAAAVGLNLVSGAIDKVRETASTAGQKARDLVELSEATKLSINELRGLKQAAGRFGVDEDKLEGWITRAAISMEKAKTGSGELADALQSISPSFLEALQNADTMAERLDVLARAAQTAKDQGKDVALFWRDAFGRGSGRADVVMQATQMAGGLAAVGNAMKQYGGAAEEEVRHRAELSEANKKLTKELDALNASLLQSTRVLELEKVALQASVALKREMVAVQKQLAESGITGLRAEAQTTRDMATPQIAQRMQARNRFPGADVLPPPSLALPPLPTAEIVKAGDEAEKAAKKIDLLNEAQKRLSKDSDWVGALGGAATSAEKAVVAVDKLTVAFLSNAFGEHDAAINAKEAAQANELFNRALASVAVQANAVTATHEAAIQTLRARTAAEREAAAAATVKASDSSGDANVRAQQAVAMEVEKQAQAHRDAMNAMQGQLEVAQAVTGVEKMAAQEAANYRDLINQGRTAQQAAAEAAKQTQIAQAQVNSAAQAQLQTLRDQYAVASAVTGAEKMRAQAAATTNALLRQGVDAGLAQKIAAQELANAQAAANIAVEQSIRSLDQQTELIRASVNGTTELVKQQQAYNNAIDSGASAQKASELVAAMQRQAQAQQAVLDSKKQKAILDAQENAAIQRATAAEREHLAIIEQEIAAENAVYQGASMLSQLDFSVGRPGEPGSSTTRRIEGIPVGGYRGLYYDIGGVANQFQTEDQFNQEHQARIQSQINDFEMRRVEAQIGGDKPGEISAVQQELAFYRSQPRTLENLNQIKSLQDALKQLTTATEDNTQASDALSGLYSRQFGQGFYDGGAAVGELIYGLDNNTGSAIDAMQHANDNNTRNQNTLLTNLSQNQVTTTAYYGGGMVNATGAVESAVTSGFSSLTYAVQHQQTTSPSPTSPSPTSPYPSTPSPSPSPFWTPGQTRFGFARGGSFTTAGYGGDDSNVVAFRVSPQRERVSIVPMNGGNAGGSSGTNNNISNNININVPQGTNEFRSTAMHIADEIFNQVAVAGRRR